MSSSHLEADFIKDKPSPWFYNLFSLIISLLFKRNFNHVFIQNKLEINSNKSYLFLLNHHTWWDGILPMFLDSQLFNSLDAKGIMDEEQLIKRLFFTRLKVFSINRKIARKALSSLEYARKHLLTNKSCLYLFPQGAIYPNNPSFFQFESGFTRIIKNNSIVNMVPIVTYIEQFYDKKPNLWIKIVEPISSDISTSQIEEVFKLNWNQVQQDAFQQSNSYDRLV